MLVDINDLRKVKGIGEKTIARIKETLCTSEEDEYVSQYDPNIYLDINDIYLGDCLDLMNGIPDKSIDMVLCDLPFGTTASKWDSVIDFDKLWLQYERVISDIGSIVLFANGVFESNLVFSNFTLYKYKWIWVKNGATNFVHAKNRPMSKYESILIFSKAPMGHLSQLGDQRMVYNPQGLVPINKQVKAGSGKFGTIAGKRPSHKREYTQEYTNYPTDVLTGFPEASPNKKLHTNQKPVDLCEYLIKTYTNENDLVLDNCIGSGTTAIACLNAGRNYIGIEKEEKYYKIAKERVKEHKLKLAV